MRYGMFVAAIAVLASLLVPTTPAAAAVIYEPPIYEPAPPPGKSPRPSQFCSGGVARDVALPFKPVRSLPSPSSKGRIGFGPKSIRLKPLPRLLTGPGPVGYTLSLRPSAPAAHLDWTVTTTLSSVDRHGRFAEKLRRTRRQISKVRQGQNAGARFRVGGQTGFYRMIAVFRNDAGRKLGKVGFYFRVMPSSRNAELLLDGGSFQRGDTVLGRVDNLGSEVVFYGTPFAIERPEGTGWALAPESPRGPWTMPLFATQPGEAGRNCSSFRIPDAMPAGRYRMSKEVGFGKWPPGDDPSLLTAEFTVRP